MAKKTQPKDAPKAEPLLDESFRNEIAALEKLSKKAVEVKGDNATLLDLSMSVTGLTLTRNLVRDLDEARKAKAKALVPEDVAKELSRLDVEAKLLKARATTLESALAAALMAEVESGRLTENVESAEHCKLVLARKDVVVVEDVEALPDEYVTRTPNLGKIEEALKAWQIKAEAAKVLGLPPPACPVPGAHMGKRVILTTKAPELIEENP